MRKVISVFVVIVLCLFSMSKPLSVGAVMDKQASPVTYDAWFTTALTSDGEVILFSCRSTIFEDGSLNIHVSPFVNNPDSKAFSLTFTEPSCVRYTDMDYIFSQNKTYSYTGSGGGGVHLCYPISKDDYLLENEDAEPCFAVSANHYPDEYKRYYSGVISDLSVTETAVENYYYIDKVVEPTVYEPYTTTFNIQKSWAYHITSKVSELTPDDYFQIYFSPQDDYQLTNTYNFRVLGHEIEVSPKTIGLYDTPNEDEAYHRLLESEIELYKNGVAELEQKLAENSANVGDYDKVVAENEQLKQTNSSLSARNKELMKENETLRAEKGDLEEKYSLQTGVVGSLQAKIEELENKIRAFRESPYFDVNHDGKVNVLDLVRLKAYLLG